MKETHLNSWAPCKGRRKKTSAKSQSVSFLIKTKKKTVLFINNNKQKKTFVTFRITIKQWKWKHFSSLTLEGEAARGLIFWLFYWNIVLLTFWPICFGFDSIGLTSFSMEIWFKTFFMLPPPHSNVRCMWCLLHTFKTIRLIQSISCPLTDYNLSEYKL